MKEERKNERQSNADPFGVIDAFGVAGKYSALFGLCFFIFFFASIPMVMGDGTAPWITYMALGVIDFTVKFLGISSKGGVVFTVVFFWAAVVFVLVFMFVLLRWSASNE